jgi:hypothetical protein
MNLRLLRHFCPESRQDVFPADCDEGPGRNALLRVLADRQASPARLERSARASPRIRQGSFFSRVSPWALAAMALALGFPLLAQQASQINPNDFSAFKIITDRNIFDPNRRPRIAAQQAEQPIVDSFSLAGTMSYEKGLFAVFDGTSSDYHRVLEPGGSIAGYLVGEIRQDAVKLSSGTNELDLTVGMQMRRNEDGRWSVGGQPQQPGTSHASDSSRRNSSRRQSISSPNRTNAQTDSQPAVAPAGESDSIDGTVTMGDPGSDATNAPPEMSNGDPNDPVARMRQRRAQELNGNENRNPNQ